MSRKDAIEQARHTHRITELQRRVAAKTVIICGAEYIPARELRALKQSGLRLATPADQPKEEIYVTNAFGRQVNVPVVPLLK